MAIASAHDAVDRLKSIAPTLRQCIDEELAIARAGGQPSDDAVAGQLSYIVGLPLVERMSATADVREREALAGLIEEMLESSDPRVHYVADTTIADALMFGYPALIREHADLWGPLTRRVLWLDKQ